MTWACCELTRPSRAYSHGTGSSNARRGSSQQLARDQKSRSFGPLFIARVEKSGIYDTRGSERSTRLGVNRDDALVAELVGAYVGADVGRDEPPGPGGLETRRVHLPVQLPPELRYDGVVAEPEHGEGFGFRGEPQAGSSSASGPGTTGMQTVMR